jgi:hypothetical protein
MLTVYFHAPGLEPKLKDDVLDAIFFLGLVSYCFHRETLCRRISFKSVFLDLLVVEICVYNSFVNTSMLLRFIFSQKSSHFHSNTTIIFTNKDWISTGLYIIWNRNHGLSFQERCNCILTLRIQEWMYFSLSHFVEKFEYNVDRLSYPSLVWSSYRSGGERWVGKTDKGVLSR